MTQIVCMQEFKHTQERIKRRAPLRILSDETVTASEDFSYKVL